MSLDRELLDLGDLDRGIGRVVELLVRATGAAIGYVEIEQRTGGYSDAGHDLPAIQAAISSHIVRRARLGGCVIATACAVADDRFEDLDSVRQHGIQAVLCIPIAPVGGALYLQGPVPFGPSAREDASRVARRIAECVLLEPTDRLDLHAATRAFQRRHVLSALARNHWAIPDTARELGVARSHLYRLITVHELRQCADGGTQ